MSVTRPSPLLEAAMRRVFEPAVLMGGGDDAHVVQAAVDAFHAAARRGQHSPQPVSEMSNTTEQGTSDFEAPFDPAFAIVREQFTYQQPSPDQVKRMAELRDKARELAMLILTSCPPSADRTSSVRYLRNAIMFANASIVLEGKA